MSVLILAAVGQMELQAGLAGGGAGRGESVGGREEKNRRNERKEFVSFALNDRRACNALHYNLGQ